MNSEVGARQHSRRAYKGMDGSGKEVLERKSSARARASCKLWLAWSLGPSVARTMPSSSTFCSTDPKAPQSLIAIQQSLPIGYCAKCPTSSPASLSTCPLCEPFANTVQPCDFCRALHTRGMHMISGSNGWGISTRVDNHAKMDADRRSPLVLQACCAGGKLQ